ncbi:MAG: hypothetical protein U1E27_11605, partial [Kiritimatiellia bacterium]|nr:hypothetical protein [Kiritimatiellia bacterium]
MIRLKKLRIFIPLFALSLQAGTVQAQEAATDAAGETAMSLLQILKAGGSLMYVLGGLSVLALAFIVYYAILLRQEAVAPRNLLLDLRDALRDGRVEEAKRACERNRSPMAAIAGAGLAYLESAENPGDTQLREIVEGEGGR